MILALLEVAANCTYVLYNYDPLLFLAIAHVMNHLLFWKVISMQFNSILSKLVPGSVTRKCKLFCHDIVFSGCEPGSNLIWIGNRAGLACSDWATLAVLWSVTVDKRDKYLGCSIFPGGNQTTLVFFLNTIKRHKLKALMLVII